jgi:hypothetical protein
MGGRSAASGRSAFEPFACKRHRLIQGGSRLDVGAPSHIIVRGVEHDAIFRDDGDRKRFVERLARLVGEEAPTCCWATTSASRRKAWGAHLRAIDAETIYQSRNVPCAGV